MVFNARKYDAVLVTADGASKSQPGGILGNRDALKKLGITVMTDVEAVALVDGAIQRRDDAARFAQKLTGEAPPEWVGRDFSPYRLPQRTRRPAPHRPQS